MSLSPETILRHAAQMTPRYTSYPTAPHFHPGIDDATYRAWLGDLPAQANLSLYVHVPFCDTLCWFCGCSTKITRRYAPVARYLDALVREIETIGEAAPAQSRVGAIHWGGGSPTILVPDDIRRLAQTLRRAFNASPDCEFAVEVDPRGVLDETIDALAQSGLTRVSIGVQDFDPKVQAAINRIQSVEETRRVIDAFRQRGVRSLNIDAIYGLPGQHAAQLSATLDAVLAMEPDRIALFGYAHVPWMKTHQSQIKEADLPGPVERWELAEMAGARLVEAGFERIGMDHFARMSDPLARAAREGRLRRNFQGYTTDDSDALLGFGASSIGRLPQGYVQNETAIAHYERRALANGSAAARGVEFTRDDLWRGRMIERVMCDMAFSSHWLDGADEDQAALLFACAQDALDEDHDGFLRATQDGFVVTDRGRPFVRTIAARFDAYLAGRKARHSLAV